MRARRTPAFGWGFLMDTRSNQLVELLDHLVAIGMISQESAQNIRIRQGAIRSVILHEKRNFHARYEPGAVEIIVCSGMSDVFGNKLDEEKIVEAWAKFKGVTYYRIDPLKLDAKLITETFGQAYARNNMILPISKNGDEVTIATDSPDTLGLSRTLSTTMRFRPKFVLSSRSSILRSITEVYGFRTSVAAAASEQTSATAAASLAIGNLEQLITVRHLDEIDASDSHVINAVDYLLNYAFSQRASDIHIEPRREQSVVRLRIDGVLHESHRLPMIVHAPIVSRFKSMARMDIAEKRRPQDGRLKTEYQNREIELRMSTMPVAFGEKVVIRVFDATKLFQSLDAIGMSPDAFGKFQRMLSARTGLILVTGPTGSGKTTTLYSALQTLSSPLVNITSIEDPVEMVCEQFNQVQVQPKIGLDFAQALRTVLRQDPDIIMVGEIRDAETAHMAVQAALTGHLVLSTLHTNDAPSAVSRLLDLQVPPFLLSSCLIGCVAQRLARKVCEHCRVERVMTEDEKRVLGIWQSSAQRRDLHVCEGKGCLDCRKTGTYGQTGIFEVFEVNAQIRQLIHGAVPVERLTKAARADGMNTLQESALQKLGAGTIPVAEVIRVLGLDCS